MSNTQFEIGDRVRFKDTEEDTYYRKQYNLPEEFTIGVVRDRDVGELVTYAPNKESTGAWGSRLELVQEQPIQNQQKETAMKTNSQTKQKLGKTQLKQDYVWALVDKKDGFIYGTYLSRREAREYKDRNDTIKKVKLEVIGRG